MSHGKKAEIRKRNVEEPEASLDAILCSLPADKSRTIGRGRETSVWLSIFPSTINGMELSAQEFHDALSMRYGDTPSDLPASCDGCQACFTLQHALDCKKGGLVIFCHNEIQDKLVHMAGKAMTPSAICDEPLVHPGRVTESVKTPPTTCTPNQSPGTPATGEDCGDLLLQGFWARGTKCIVDVHVTDTNAKSYCKQAPAKVLESQEKEKK
jgi:hypothetical protein